MGQETRMLRQMTFLVLLISAAALGLASPEDSNSIQSNSNTPPSPIDEHVSNDHPVLSDSVRAPHIEACKGHVEGDACSFTGRFGEKIVDKCHTCKKKNIMVCGKKPKGLLGKGKGQNHRHEQHHREQHGFNQHAAHGKGKGKAKGKGH